ncbi:MAG: hypothetical protein Q4B08_12300, partial [Propionibacteriaceae bacterium]|nr:hypothetical protein [Propionibacteriaceae bacterium]
MTPRAADSPVLRARFDGQRWVEGSLEGQDYAVPPLVDWACGIGGYREGVTSSMLRAPRAILKLLSEQGIATIRVLSSSWSELWRWQAVQGEQGWSVNTIGGGPTLVDSEPASERERWIRNLDCLDRAMDHVVLEELGWVSVRTENRDFAQAVALRARQRGLHLAVRGPVALT